ncbi:MAG: spore coat protein CotJB [Clostridiaceae bacterium]|nr:spore coat protein CotJB [Clostridiaceae bacterium]
MENVIDNLRDNKAELKKALMAAKFAALEMQLYLDTHPYDTKALQMHHEYAKKAAKLMDEYQQKYGPIVAGASGTKCPWQWASQTWTWE